MWLKICCTFLKIPFFWRKQAFTPGNSAKMCGTPWKSQGNPKVKNQDPIPHEFSLEIHLFFNWLQEFPHVLHYSWKLHFVNHPLPVYVTWGSCFFFKKTLLWYCIYLLYLINSSVLLQSVPFFHDSLSIIYQLFLQ